MRIDDQDRSREAYISMRISGGEELIMEEISSRYQEQKVMHAVCVAQLQQGLKLLESNLLAMCGRESAEIIELELGNGFRDIWNRVFPPVTSNAQVEK